MAIQIPIITSLEDSGIKAAKAAFNNFKTEVGKAEGAMGKFKAGGKAALDAVKANAATFALAAGASVATFAAKAIGDFNRVALAAGELADATGLTVEEASRLAEVAGDIGIETGALETSIGKMNKVLGQSPDLFKELGVEVAYAQDGTIDANETFLNTIDRLNGIKDPAERAMVASQLLGKGWQSMSELIAGGSNKLRASLAEVSDAKVINTEELEKARKFRSSMDNLKDSAEDLSIELGNTLIPLVTGLIDGFAKVAGFIDDIRSIRGPSKEIQAELDDMIYGEERAVEAATAMYQGYYESRKRAIDQDKYLIKGLEDTTDATYDLNIGWQRLLNTLDNQEAIRQAQEAVDDMKIAAAEAFADPSKVAAYEEAVADVIREIALLAETINLSNEDQNKLLVLVDTGQLERAVQLLAVIKTGANRGMNITVGQAAQHLMESQAYLNALVGPIPGRAMGGPVSSGTYLVGERGPELLTLGSGQSGYVTPNHALGGGTNITINTSADPNEVVRVLQSYVRQYGPIPVTTRPT